MKKSKLKRRLRKKYRVGEFREFGLRIFVNFHSGIDETWGNRFRREFVGEIERHKLTHGGGNSVNYLHGFISAAKNYQSPTPVQRQKFKSWLEGRPEIASIEVGNLADAWYDVD